MIISSINYDESVYTACRKANISMQDPLMQAVKGDIIQVVIDSLTPKGTDTTDQRIVKISTIIGTFAGGAVTGVFLTPLSIPGGMAAGYAVGWGAGKGIVKVKHVVQDKCLIL